ncbi:hypothetical protein SPBR_06250 [Sporothrix brasiliensis 5110]|uniref:Bicarbonate transporter-like transmembrane domain-containing protein n=1 Tax=Sporothrix brasiliensis 5110 TaxID=1398154 RepID=A0A0C2F6V9_9PEZI|nr:uncharacterized protein SPBR_06250 [Sporothrix brasiliensis 5110]KIH94669.1 hypothetical protein SPBR_06250 [Sporothrix brasiliensis 5110]
MDQRPPSNNGLPVHRVEFPPSQHRNPGPVFNQLVFASAVYVFFTNILPGITFASDLDVLTGQSWGTIEVVFSTGLCGLIFSL